MGLFLLVACKNQEQSPFQSASDGTSSTEEALPETDYESSLVKWGYIDRQGKRVIPARFDDNRDFSEGLAVVRLKGDWGFIDKKGDIAIPLQYKGAYSFHNGLARVQSKADSMGMIDKNGKWVITPQWEELQDLAFGRIRYRFQGRYGFLNKKGQSVIEPLFEEAFPVFEAPGFARAKQSGKWGLIDTNGTWVVKPGYSQVGTMQEGLLKVSVEGKWGFVDNKGKTVIKPQYELATDFKDGMAVVSSNLKFGVINSKGKWVIPADNEYLKYAGYGLFIVGENGQFGLLDKLGNELLSPSLEQLYAFQANGVAWYAIDNQWGLLDTTGTFVTNPEYGLPWDMKEDLIRTITFEGEFIFLNSQGIKRVSAPYADVRDFSEGLARYQE